MNFILRTREGIIFHVYITGDSVSLGDRSETRFQLVEQFLHRCKNLWGMFTRGYLLSWKWLLEIVVHSRFLRLHFSKERKAFHPPLFPFRNNFFPSLSIPFLPPNRIESKAKLASHHFFITATRIPLSSPSFLAQNVSNV